MKSIGHIIHVPSVAAGGCLGIQMPGDRPTFHQEAEGFSSELLILCDAQERER